ncbi:MAG: hypothetical protein KAV87_36025 [Desulfobacteraceae bacterium]|nr:hypothetical protein [Desulfobacteraceae bacterium]
MMFVFDLGDYVKDEATGFEGRINGRAIWDTGNIQYSIKPMVKDDGQMPNGHWIDGDHLAVIPGRSIKSNYGNPLFVFNIGDKVKSVLIPFSGHVKGCVQWINGCLEYIVVSSELNDGKSVQDWFCETELEKIADPVPRETRKCGGPDSPSDRY